MKDSIKSVVVITAICLVIAAALGVTNYFTKDVIEEGTRERTQTVLGKLIEGGDFEELDVGFYADLPYNVSAIYKETNGKGYVFQITTKGYDSGLVIMCAISVKGEVIKTSTLSSNETPTLGGDKVINDQSYTDKYIGANTDSVNGVDTVSGATITSKAYRAAVSDALKAFAIVHICQE